MPWILLNHISAEFRVLWHGNLNTCLDVPVMYVGLKTLLGVGRHNVQIKIVFVVPILFATSEEIACSWSWWMPFPNLTIRNTWCDENHFYFNLWCLLLVGQTEELEEGVWAAALSCLLYLVCDHGRMRRQRLNGLDIRVRTLRKTCWETVTKISNKNFWSDEMLHLCIGVGLHFVQHIVTPILIVSLGLVKRFIRGVCGEGFDLCHSILCKFKGVLNFNMATHCSEFKIY